MPRIPIQQGTEASISNPCALTGRQDLEAAESSAAHRPASLVCGLGKKNRSVSNKVEGEEIPEAILDHHTCTVVQMSLHPNRREHTSYTHKNKNHSCCLFLPRGRILLCCPDWPQICSNSPASYSQVLQLQHEPLCLAYENLKNTAFELAKVQNEAFQLLHISIITLCHVLSM